MLLPPTSNPPLRSSRTSQPSRSVAATTPTASADTTGLEVATTTPPQASPTTSTSTHLPPPPLTPKRRVTSPRIPRGRTSLSYNFTRARSPHRQRATQAQESKSTFPRFPTAAQAEERTSSTLQCAPTPSVRGLTPAESWSQVSSPTLSTFSGSELESSARNHTPPSPVQCHPCS